MLNDVFLWFIRSFRVWQYDNKVYILFQVRLSVSVIPDFDPGSRMKTSSFGNVAEYNWS